MVQEAFNVTNNMLYKKSSDSSSWQYACRQNIHSVPYILETNIKFSTRDNVGYNYGVYVGDDNTYHYVILFDQVGNKIAIWRTKYPEGVSESILSTTTNYPLSLGTWYKLRAVVTSSNIQIDFYDGSTWHNNILNTNQTTKISYLGYYGYATQNKFYADDFVVRKYASPEPSVSLGSEQAIPVAATIGTPIALSSSSIRWNFTDNADNETGFRLYDNTDTIATSSATANLTYLDETGLSENTQYSGRYVKAYNSYGNSLASATSTAIYTLADTPTNLTLTAQSTTQIDSSVDTFPNHSSGQSGYYFANTTASTNSGWQAGDNTWSETTLAPNTQYNYTVKYRNGDATETSTIQGSKYTFIQTPTGISFDSIGVNSITALASGTLSNLTSSSSGLYFDETSGNTGGADSTWLQTNSYQNIGLSENTLYTYRVKARNGDATETSYTATSSRYTLADTPTNLTATNVSSQSIILSVDTLPNATSGSSGYYFSNTTRGTNSGWIQTNTWQDTGLGCGTDYTYYVKYRNGDGTETDAISITQRSGSCAVVMPPFIQSAQPTVTPQLGTGTIAAATTTGPAKAPKQPSAPSAAPQAGIARQAAIQEIKAQILVIQQKIIELIAQLVQLIQAKITELQSQLP